MRALFVAMCLVLFACNNVVDEVKEQGLEDLLEDQVDDHGFISVGASVRLDDGDRIRASVGHVAPLGGEAYDVLHTEQVIGSVTKLYTAVLVMQLVEEGRVDLDARVDTWLDFPGADAISVRMLLNHTSGLNDYLNVMSLAQVGQPWTPPELLGLALAQGPLGAPGMDKAIYSNTNFLVLAMIVEAETGVSWEDNLAARIVAPLGLSHTYFAGETGKAGDLVGGWMQTEAGWLDSMTLIHPSVGWAIGGMVTTNDELLRFTGALFDGELFTEPATLAAMRRFEVETDPAYQNPAEPPSRVGLAITSMTYDSITLEGHLGHIEGFNAAALHDPARDEIIVVTSNDDRAYAGPIAFDVARFLRDL
jgi:CubicO group peptidase (beta-lactamase class C family)